LFPLSALCCWWYSLLCVFAQSEGIVSQLWGMFIGGILFLFAVSIVHSLVHQRLVYEVTQQKEAAVQPMQSTSQSPATLPARVPEKPVDEPQAVGTPVTSLKRRRGRSTERKDSVTSTPRNSTSRGRRSGSRSTPGSRTPRSKSKTG
jgi:hypothetical protein